MDFSEKEIKIQSKEQSPYFIPSLATERKGSDRKKNKNDPRTHENFKLSKFFKVNKINSSIQKIFLKTAHESHPQLEETPKKKDQIRWEASSSQIPKKKYLNLMVSSKSKWEANSLYQ